MWVCVCVCVSLLVSVFVVVLGSGAQSRSSIKTTSQVRWTVHKRNFTHEENQADCAKVFTLSGVFLSVLGSTFFSPDFFLSSNEFSVRSGLAVGYYLTSLWLSLSHSVRCEENLTLYLLPSRLWFVFCLFCTLRSKVVSLDTEETLASVTRDPMSLWNARHRSMSPKFVMSAPERRWRLIWREC